MEDFAQMKPARSGLRTWLLTDTPASPRQAALGRAYRRWRRFSSNPLSMLGLAILLLLVVMLNFRILSSRPGRVVQPARDAAPA